MTQCVRVYVLDNKPGSLSLSRMASPHKERGQRDNDHSVSAMAYITGQPERWMWTLQTHAHWNLWGGPS